MMIRSAPPASAHFADRPVPAPAPMIGAALADLLAQPRERLVRAVIARLPISSCSAVGHRRGERRVVDVGVDLVHLDLVAVDPLAQRVEQRRVGLGVVERLALDVDRRDAAQRHEQHRRARRRR